MKEAQSMNVKEMEMIQEKLEVIDFVRKYVHDLYNIVISLIIIC